MAELPVGQPMLSMKQRQLVAQLVVGLLWLALLVVLGSSSALLWGMQVGAQGLLWLLGAAVLYVVPGLALLRWLWRDATVSPLNGLVLAPGLSVAVPPLLLELAHLVGIPWTSVTTYCYVVIALLLLALSYRMPRRLSLRMPLPDFRWHGFLLAGLLSSAALVRLYVVRDLPVGMWGDSYQHTMMAQLLVDNHGLFSSWEPYAPLTSFTYHFGFHANVAFWHLLTGMPTPQSLLYVGQLMNVAALTGAYALTVRCTGRQSAGLAAVMLTGFVNAQPAFFVNWGRYTQLAGQVILPVLLIIWIGMIEEPTFSWRQVILAALVTAGLMLTHYIVTIFAALFVLAYLVLVVARSPRRTLLRQVVARSTPSALLALLLAAPWLLNTLHGHLTRNVGGFVNKSVGAERLAEASQLVALSPLFLHWGILVLAGSGLLVALSRREWRMGLCAAWSVLLFIAVLPHVFGLPGTGIVNTFTAYIALYITVVPLAAYVLSWAYEHLMRHWPRVGSGLAVGALVGVSVWGVHWQQRLIDPYYQLFTQSDAAAMQWIREHTRPDVLFLVNMFPAFGGTLFAGSDGGWWIPLLTERRSTLPPLTYGSERGSPPDLGQRVNELANALRDHPLPSAEGLRLARAVGIQYIYSGAHVGQEQRIDVEALRQHPAFRVVYDRDQVVIFELLPGP